MADEARGDGRQERGARRELRFWEAMALSIATMAPGAAMAFNTTATAAEPVLRRAERNIAG